MGFPAPFPFRYGKHDKNTKCIKTIDAPPLGVTNSVMANTNVTVGEEMTMEQGVLAVGSPENAGTIKGDVKSGPLTASAGATVTLYPKAAEGCVLDTVEVPDAEGNAVQLDGLKFAIPAGGVTVNATFKPAQ